MEIKGEKCHVRSMFDDYCRQNRLRCRRNPLHAFICNLRKALLNFGEG